MTDKPQVTPGRRMFWLGWSPFLLSLLVLLLGIVATALFARQLAQTAEQRDRQQFESSTRRQQDAIAAHIDTYLALIRGAAGLFASQEGDVTDEEFHGYVKRLNLRERYPGILGIGYAKRIDVSATRPGGATQRTQFKIQFLEPLDTANHRALGFDMYAEPTRRAAMDHARDRGVISASGRVTLVQDAGLEQQPGFLIYLPLYLGGVVPDQLSERREMLQGFVYSPFRSREVFAAMSAGKRDTNIDFDVYDADHTSDANLLYRSARIAHHAARYTDQRTLSIAGRTWVVVTRSSRTFDAALDERLIPAMFGGGALLSLLLAGIVWMEARSRMTAEQDRRRIVEANNAVRQSAEQFQLLANSIPQLAWMARPDGHIFWYNQRWYDYTGTTLEQMQGWGWKEVHHPDMLPRVMEQWNHSLRTGRPFDMTFPLRGADGLFRPFLTRIVPLVDADCKVVFWFGTNTDLSERVKLEERFRLTADAAPVMIWLADARPACVWFNRTWLDFTGRNLEEECGDIRVRGVHAEDLNRYLQAFREGFDHRQPFKLEYRLRHQDGKWRWVLDHGVPLFEGPGGGFSGYIGSCIDIHDRKQAEAERQALLESERAARTDAERASRLKDEFLATLSHELRTPLNAILGWAQILDKRALAGSFDDVKRGLDVITRNARVQSQLIEDLLDMSRIISGKLRLDVQKIDPANAIQAAVESVRPAAEAKEIRVEEVIDHHAGPVRGDPARLQQVVWNLLTNAIKFTPKRGKVQVSLARINSHIEITVTDTGEGIAAEFLPHVFDRFRQADGSTTRQHGGLGLGLAIVQSLVEAHGGKVRVKSPGVGKGATFIVELPLMVVHEAHESEPRAHPRRTPVASGANDYRCADGVLEGLRVLVVDDEADARELIRRVIEECKASVIVASSVEEALTLLARERPDVMVSDIGMPGQDGYELIRRLRTLSPDEGGQTPAAALTAFARSEDRRRALLAGYQAHIAKPVEPAELVTVIASLTGRIRTSA